MLTKETFIQAITAIRKHEELMDRLDAIGYSPEVRLCTRTSGRIVWHREETTEAGFRESDELVVIDEYGKVVPLKEFLASIGVQQKNGY